MNNRIISIDVLRGFALLGILIMNIVLFAMPTQAYYNPFVYELSSWDQLFFAINHVIADQKFMAIFSMLFGASTLLFIQSASKKGQKAGLLFYSRNFWLLLIGLIHSVFIWHGDILLIYAICSFLLFLFRNLNPRIQLGLGLLIYLLPALLNLYVFSTSLEQISPAEQQAFINQWTPDDATLQKEIDAFRGTYSDQINYRLRNSENEQNTSENAGMMLGLFLLDFFGRAFGMMLIGMALFSWKVFSNLREKSFYLKWVKYGLGVGFSLSILGIILFYQFDWQWQYGLFWGKLPNTLATPFTALGYVGLIMLWTRTDFLQDLQNRMAAIGKIALSGYLGESIIATSIFYGLGLYGDLNRGALWLVTFLIWGFFLWFAPFWTQRFRFGPLEWIWRCLTYLRIVPLRKVEQPAAQNARA
ncbi:MAG: DUF418 domain-containing protein [Bacteroidota bacterium]